MYEGMAQGLRDMSVALPLVQDLRDEAMRERHWKKLMRICGKSFVMDDKFCLKHLLALQLQAHVNAVGETVEQARMELKIDKQLARIDATWMSLHLEYEPFKSTGVHVLKMPTLVVEALDEHEVALQNMMGSRYMSFFESQISSWKSKLAGVRAVLESWMEVQRQWCSLEAIFIGCKFCPYLTHLDPLKKRHEFSPAHIAVAHLASVEHPCFQRKTFGSNFLRMRSDSIRLTRRSKSRCWRQASLLIL